MTVLWKVIYCVVIAAVAQLLAKISKWVIDRIFSAKLNAIMKTEAKAKTLKAVISSAIRFAVYLIAVLTILTTAGVSPTSLAAVSGSIAVAIGLGAQSIVSDIIAGIFIIIEEQFNVGDVISINGCTGTVESVTMRTTRLRDADGTVYIIPNGTISTVTNKCKEFINAMVDVGVAYEEDTDKVIAVLKDELSHAENSVDGLMGVPEVLGITDLADSAVIIRIVAKCRVKTNFAVERELRLRIKRRFDREGIVIPYPQRSVHLINQEGQ